MITPSVSGSSLNIDRHVDEVEPGDGIAADAHAGRLPDAER
jgi:hypothetical protein